MTNPPSFPAPAMFAALAEILHALDVTHFSIEPNQSGQFTISLRFFAGDVAQEVTISRRTNADDPPQLGMDVGAVFYQATRMKAAEAEYIAGR